MRGVVGSLMGPGQQSKMLGLALADVARQIARLLRPQWARFRSIVRTILCGLDLVVLFALAKAGPWVVMADAGHLSSDLQRILDVLNRCMFWSFPLVAVGPIAVAVPEFLALRRGTSPAACRKPSSARNRARIVSESSDRTLHALDVGGPTPTRFVEYRSRVPVGAIPRS